MGNLVFAFLLSFYFTILVMCIGGVLWALAVYVSPILSFVVGLVLFLSLVVFWYMLETDYI